MYAGEVQGWRQSGGRSVLLQHFPGAIPGQRAADLFINNPHFSKQSTTVAQSWV